MDLFIILPILFFSIVLHEFAHGYVAYRMGDDTAYFMGRLTLNPLKHVDVVGTILVPAVCYISHLPMFGWAKPVPINAARFSSPRAGMGKVALAGPAANLSLAVLCAVLIKAVLMTQAFADETTARLVAFAVYGIQINVLLAVFNLIPVPPLDGGHIVVALLPYSAAQKYAAFFGRYGMYVVLVLILTGAFKYIIYPPMYFIVRVLGGFIGW